jgi:hypothetical protein
MLSIEHLPSKLVGAILHHSVYGQLEWKARLVDQFREIGVAAHDRV